MKRENLINSDEMIVFVAERGHGQGGAAYGPIEDHATAWRQCCSDDVDKVIEVWRIDMKTGTRESLTAEFAAWYVEENETPGKYDPAFMEPEDWPCNAPTAEELRDNARGIYW